jgi:hypothetical protein
VVFDPSQIQQIRLMTVPSADSTTAPSPRRRRKLLGLIFAICAAPVIASYLAYYLVRPGARTNYGELIEPQRPLPALRLGDETGRPVDVATWRGHWVMLQVDGARCEEDCRRKLWDMRQLRLTTGRERDRILRVWLVTDDAALDPALQRDFDGTAVLRADPDELRALLVAGRGTDGAGDGLRGSIWIVDPLGNVMLRWPADGDPQRMKRDLNRLLAASSIG